MLDLTDPNISKAYHSVVENQALNWFLLGYFEDSDALRLSASGTKGVSEMKHYLQMYEDVYYGFIRETLDGQTRYVIINYVPEWTTEERRETVPVHLRHVAALLEAEEAILSVSHPDMLSTAFIKETLLPPIPPKDTPIHSKALPPSPEKIAKIPVPSRINQPKLSSPSKSGFLLQILKRKKRGWTGQSPPYPPPKDEDGPRSSSLSGIQADSRGNRPSQEKEGWDEFGAVNQHGHVECRDFVPAQLQSAHLRAKWGGSETLEGLLHPELEARRREDMRRQREEEELEAAKQEEIRQVRIRAEKEASRRQEAEDEKRRKAKLQEELERAGKERRKREMEQRAEEERRAQEIEERRRLSKERRLELGKRWEEWRQEQRRQMEETMTKKEEARRQAEEERLKEIRKVEAKLKKSHLEELMVGWVTVQAPDSVVWKRRWFKFSGSSMMFYRNPQDVSLVLDVLELKNRVRGLREWHEGYDDLEAIPHSFAIEFVDSGPWMMYADNSDSKIEILGYIHQAANL